MDEIEYVPVSLQQMISDNLQAEASKASKTATPKVANTGRKCLKCQHVRSVYEMRTPAYECPNCGAIYDKVDAAMRQGGFTLVELMVTVAIVAILSSVALPSYAEYVTKTRLTEAFSSLASARVASEQFWSNNRTYAGFDASNAMPTASGNFGFALSGASASGYTLTATGQNQLAGFSFTINETGARATTAAPSGWATSGVCWINSKGGGCAG